MKIPSYEKTSCLNLPDEIEIKLFSIFKELNKLYGATYMSYTHDRYNSVRYSFRTDQKWASMYNTNKIGEKSIIEQCPLDIASRERKNLILIWDSYSHSAQPKIFREIMGMREDIGLTHGITLSTYFDNHHDALAIATEDKKNDVALKILEEKNKKILSDYLISCRKLVFNCLSIGN